MDNYLVKMISGTEFWITAEEYKNLLQSNGLITLQRLQRTINKNSISEIIPKDQYEFEKNPNSGILHDGTKVIRYFGSWYLEGEINENGKPCKLIDPEYYPEIIMDCVPNPREYFFKYANLPIEERKKLITKRVERNPEILSGLINKKLLK